MSEAREKRNKQIAAMYMQGLRRGLTGPQAVDAIFESEENRRWCLRHDTIRLIATYKGYGLTTEQRHALEEVK
jgi:hypothetical protein